MLVLSQVAEELWPLIFQRSKVPVVAFDLLAFATHPGGGVDGGALFDQHVGDAHVTFLSHEVQGG